MGRAVSTEDIGYLSAWWRRCPTQKTAICRPESDIPTPALPGSGSTGVISARSTACLGHPVSLGLKLAHRFGRAPHREVGKEPRTSNTRPEGSRPPGSASAYFFGPRPRSWQGVCPRFGYAVADRGRVLTPSVDVEANMSFVPATPVGRAEAARAVLDAKRNKNLTWEAIATELGRSKVWTTAALLGQHRISAEMASAVGEFLNLDEVVVQALQLPPERGADMVDPSDPAVYRL